MMIRYGLPYRGSKRRFADRLLSAMPGGGRAFIDVCCGGCSMAHAAAVSGRYGAVVANDANPKVIRMLEFLKGCSDDDVMRCLTMPRELFMQERFNPDVDGETYLRVLLNSFGYNLRSYMCDEESSRRNHLVNLVVCSPDLQVRESAMNTVISEKLADGVELRNVKVYGRVAAFKEALSCIALSSVDYSELPIEKDSVLYFDPPYAGTETYNKSKFDSERFMKFLREHRGSAPMFISEYAMPSDFLEVLAIETRSTIGPNDHCVTEKLYFNGGADEYRKLMEEG